MCQRLQVRLGKASVSVRLDDSATARALAASCPFTAEAHRWGAEVYFATPLAKAPEPATAETVAAGAVAFWPPGRALCLFWGPTPLSVGAEIRPASAVAVVGRMEHWAAAQEVLEAVEDPLAVEVTLAPTVE